MSGSRTFTKPALSIEQQIERLSNQGLIISDKAKAETDLRAIGFYRFCGYALHWRINHDGANNTRFLPGITFEDIIKISDLDRDLRSHIFEAVERIEVAIRAVFSNNLGTAHGAHWFENPSLFVARYDHEKLINYIKKVIHFDNRKTGMRYIFINHYLEKYDNPVLPPTWMIFEVLSIGAISKIYENLTSPCKKLISDEFGLNKKILGSWLETITILRNYCAHHARIWNRHFPVKPVIPHLYEPYFKHIIVSKKNNKLEEIGDFGLHTQLFILNEFLIIIEDKSQWMDRLFDILSNYDTVNRTPMGFPDNWAGFPTASEMESVKKAEEAAQKAARAAAKPSKIASAAG